MNTKQYIAVGLGVIGLAACASTPSYTIVKTSHTVTAGSGIYGLTDKTITISGKDVPYTVLNVGEKKFILNAKDNTVRVFNEGKLVQSVEDAEKGVGNWFNDPTIEQKITIAPANLSGSINTQ